MLVKIFLQIDSNWSERRAEGSISINSKELSSEKIHQIWHNLMKDNVLATLWRKMADNFELPFSIQKGQGC